MPYPSRPHLEVLPEWRDLPRTRGRQPEHARLVAFIAEQYATGRSLREISELTGRSHGRVRDILDGAGVRRREAGAPSVPAAAAPP